MKKLFKAFLSIRSRIWIALAMLALSTMLVGLFAWVSLDRANEELDSLHQQTLSEVAQALSISKRSADLATSAPFLLNLSSNYRINREGKALVETLDKISIEWAKNQQRTKEELLSGGIALSLTNMRSAIHDLINASATLDSVLETVNTTNNKLSSLQNIFARRMQTQSLQREERLNWLALQSMANQALGAGFAGNLLGVGEYQRNFITQRNMLEAAILTPEQGQKLREIYMIASGETGVFELRRKELSLNLAAQNALFHISYNAGLISDFAGQFTRKAEVLLSTKRKATSSSINFAKSLIIAVGLLSIALALTSALYVSNYVTNNISKVANAMKQLAAGDRKLELPNSNKREDEIGDLFRSFRVFRANALRLDRSNHQLSRRNQLFEKIYNNISDGVAVTDKHGNLNAANPVFQNLITASDIGENKNIFALFKATEFSNAVSISISNIKNSFKGFHEVETSDGLVFEIRITRLPDEGIVWLFTDATERKKVDERLNEIRRIESLAKMTGEVAHDFANILSTISSNIYLLETGDTSKRTTAINQRISNAVEIGTSLTQRLLAFAKKQHLSPEITELNALVEGLIDLISIGLRDEVSLSAVYFKDELFIKVDPGQLESAILNLCLNSNYAIVKNGKIKISIFAESPGVATIEVSDDGVGMDDKTSKQAMEPFFSNRQDGHGTGLGLSMVYGFIKQSGGDIQIDSKPKFGTVIKLLLPTVNGDEDNKAGGLKGTALIVEDDEIALMATKNHLERLGLTVVTSNTFHSGMEHLNSNKSFDLIVTDLQLDNGNDGWRIAEKALAASDTTKVLIVSGKLPHTHPLIRANPDRLQSYAKPTNTKNFEDAVNSIFGK